MAILVKCACGDQIWANDSQAGQTYRCPSCGREQIVPSPNAIQPGPAARPRRKSAEEQFTERPTAEPAETSQRKTSGKAVVSLVMGLGSLCVPLIPSFLAMLFGFLGLRDIGRSEGRLKGKGLAWGGMIAGLVGLLVCTPLYGLGGYLGWTFGSEANSKQRSFNNLQQIGMAIQNYESTHNQLPPAVVYNQRGEPLYSWRVLILPYLEHDSLYKQFKLDEPWDSSHNKALLAQMPRQYAPPKNVKTPEPHSTFYQVFNGTMNQYPAPIWASNLDPRMKGFKPPPGVTPPGMYPVGFGPPGPQGPTTFGRGRQPRIATIPDGTANTFMVVEAGDAVPWSKPADIDYTQGGGIPKLGGLFNGDFYACFADGSVRWIRKSASPATIRALITCDDGQVIPGDF